MAAPPIPGAWAVVKDEPPRVFLAEDEQVISRVLAFKVVAEERPDAFTADELAQVRDHLLHERWAEAVLMWMTATDTEIDVYPELVQVWSEAELDREIASMAIRTSRLFDEHR